MADAIELTMGRFCDGLECLIEAYRDDLRRCLGPTNFLMLTRQLASAQAVIQSHRPTTAFNEAAIDRARNAITDGNEVTLWPDETEVVVAAMLAFAKQAPEGWVLVPRKSTEAMIEAAKDAEDEICSEDAEPYILAIYAAMLDASPSVGEGV